MYFVIVAYDGILGGAERNYLEVGFINAHNIKDAECIARRKSEAFIKGSVPLHQLFTEVFGKLPEEELNTVILDDLAYDIYSILLPDDHIDTHFEELNEILQNETENFLLSLCSDSPLISYCNPTINYKIHKHKMYKNQ